MEIIAGILIGLILSYIFVKRDLISFIIGIDSLLMVLVILNVSYIYLLILGALEAAIGVAVGALSRSKGGEIEI